MKKSVKILWTIVFGGMGLFILMLLLINFRVIGNMLSIENLENRGTGLASEVSAEDGTIVGKYYQKVQECLLTVKLERHFTKQEIIALYLNTALFGDNVYGIENAACTFFCKDAGHLSLEEAATLIGMLRGKNFFDPRHNLRRALDRRNAVIEMMERYDFITQAEANALG